MELIVFLMGQITCKGVAKKNSIKCFSLQNNLRVDYNNFIKIWPIDWKERQKERRNGIF